MPSPVSARRIGEWALRVLSCAILVAIVMRAWNPRDDSARIERAGQRDVAQSLVRWSVSKPERVVLVLDSALSGTQRDWLAAIERAGTRVTWSSARLVPIAATVTREADPAGVLDLAVSAPARSAIVVRNQLGVLASAIAPDAGLRTDIPDPAGQAAVRIGATSGGATAWAESPDSVIFKRLLVEGAASWETKFTIAALAERGWKVDALTHVAPGVDVREGNPAAPDTSRYAAIVAVDSTASLVNRAAHEFVRRGGGLVTLHDASAIGPRSANWVVLERRAGGEIRASRFANGRIVRVGYADLWRDRMSSDTVADPVAAHRALLARIVASVAYAPGIPENGRDSLADPAPLADMVDRIGPRSTIRDDMHLPRHEVPSSVLFGVLAASLLLELASRRMRGAR